MKTIRKYLSIVLVALFAFTACSLEGEDNNTSTENKTESKETADKKTDENMKIGVSLSTLNNPFFVSIREGIEEGAGDDAETVISDAQNDSSTQSNQVEDLITQGVDLIIINPVDSTAIASSVEKANEANIPVICVDRGTDSGEIVSFIASNNVEGGKLAGEYILEKVGEDAEVVQLEGIPGASSTRERGEGFKEATDGKINLVASQTANFDRAEGLTVMENLLQAHPDVKAVFCQNDEMALGASEAIKTSGKDIVVVGFDGNEDAISAVEDGSLSATVAQKPKEMGKLAIETAIKYLKGETVDEQVDSPLELVK
ncbi:MULTISPECIES: D-ribose ABC transporter substrate-binding protein [Anaerococcus]|uniref:D-ribose-binding periplasmic protein n=1 Tax=Anaerococcus octavius TaxID=54007 RepID=A0A380WVQ3_9FIRM|nr:MULTISPECIES: D-ribose ABC transporter substrate-binding protein [Anaerococcus]MDU2598714.1 D-ribose ABC transporter substrate-binding protein [Anaerococcus sp.]MDU3177105.1 D-ribose ABC transporter substrate-binding protein [Anaerococcus sp.]SUU93108.1 D-ribose-binding periplasmic protein precursor [Anaerococcus octavius]